MRIRLAKKILKIMAQQTDSRYFDSEYSIKDDSKLFHRFKYLYVKATIRWNKANDPRFNVSIFRAILRNSKSCGRCKHYEGNEFIGRCVKLNTNTESKEWCARMFFGKKKQDYDKRRN